MSSDSINNFVLEVNSGVLEGEHKNKLSEKEQGVILHEVETSKIQEGCVDCFLENNMLRRFVLKGKKMGVISEETIVTLLNGEFHSFNDEPAYVIILDVVQQEKWFENGVNYRAGDKYSSTLSMEDSIVLNYTKKDGSVGRDNDKPSMVTMRKSTGEVLSESWFGDNVQKHRVSGPASIDYKNGRVIKEEYFIHGEVLDKQEWLSNELVQEYYRSARNINSIVTDVSL